MSKTVSSSVTLGFLWHCCCQATDLKLRTGYFLWKFLMYKNPSQILTRAIREISLLMKLLSMNGFLKIKKPFFLFLKRMKQSPHCPTCLEFIFHSALCVPPLCHRYIIHYVPLIVFAPTIVPR